MTTKPTWAKFTATSLKADTSKRTITGVVLPFSVRTADRRALAFAPGSLSWGSPAATKLDREHDFSQLIGVATELEADDTAVTGTFRVARTPAGDEALSLAADGILDGFSGLVDIVESTVDEETGLTTVTKATLRRVTITADPAFTDARVTSVAATRQTTEPKEPTVDPAPDALTTALTTALEQFTANRPTLVTPPALTVREPLVYQLDGRGDSFVRDAWTARNARYGSNDAEDALARLGKYSEQTAALANAGNTTDQAEVIAPGYRPDLYVGQLPQGRPLFDSIGTRITLTSATQFKVPVFVSAAGLNGTNSEGTGPTTGTITDHTYLTVTPVAQSGEFVLTRELMDSSNPAIDVIAMNAMREEYSQDTEAVIASALAAATDNDTGSGQSTEGCYVYTCVGDGTDLAQQIRTVEGEYPGHRFATPDRMLASSAGYGALVSAVDGMGRPLFPFMAPSNAQGGVGRSAASLQIDGLACPNAWSMTSTYDDVVLFTASDLLVGESGLLEFKFFEKGGPENIYLNIWGYFAFQILRYTGIHAINYTGV